LDFAGNTSSVVLATNDNGEEFQSKVTKLEVAVEGTLVGVGVEGKGLDLFHIRSTTEEAGTSI